MTETLKRSKPAQRLFKALIEVRNCLAFAVEQQLFQRATPWVIGSTSPAGLSVIGSSYRYRLSQRAYSESTRLRRSPTSCRPAADFRLGLLLRRIHLRRHGIQARLQCVEAAVQRKFQALDTVFEDTDPSFDLALIVAEQQLADLIHFFVGQVAAGSVSKLVKRRRTHGLLSLGMNVLRRARRLPASSQQDDTA